uniref:Y1_Tnp domain-containing protein n=1 Tax=Brugia pahangi TaxID=6280 RepID=A0A0N4TTW6_BRUPA
MENSYHTKDNSNMYSRKFKSIHKRYVGELRALFGISQFFSSLRIHDHFILATFNKTSLHKFAYRLKSSSTDYLLRMLYYTIEQNEWETSNMDLHSGTRSIDSPNEARWQSFLGNPLPNLVKSNRNHHNSTPGIHRLIILLAPIFPCKEPVSNTTHSMKIDFCNKSLDKYLQGEQLHDLSPKTRCWRNGHAFCNLILLLQKSEMVHPSLPVKQQGAMNEQSRGMVDFLDTRCQLKFKL